MFLRSFGTAAALLLSSAPLLADGLDASVVDARAKVLIHVDVEALTRTTFFGLLAEHPDGDIADALVEFEREVGLDPLTDIRSFTVYGMTSDDEDWVALVRTNDKLDQAIATVAKNAGYEKRDVDGRTIHSFQEDGETWFGYAFHSSKQGSERLFVMADRVEPILDAIAVVEGDSQSLDDARKPLIRSDPGPGSLLYVSVGTAFDELSEYDLTGEISKLVQGFTLDVGEADKIVYAEATLQTKDHDSALKVQQVIEGGLALLSLFATTDSELKPLQELVNTLSVQRKETVVSLTFKYPALALFERLVALDED